MEAMVALPPAPRTAQTARASHGSRITDKRRLVSSECGRIFRAGRCGARSSPARGGTPMRCSFCDKEARDRRALLFEKWREAICDECLAVCRDIIEDDNKVAPAPAPLTLPKPSEIDDFLARLPARPWAQLRCLLTTPPPTRKPDLPPSCSFCDDANPGKLMAGPTAFICDRCVAQGTLLLQQNSRLIEFQPAQIAGAFPRPDSLAQVLSDGQRTRVLDEIREELRRRQEALSSAMQLAATTAAIETTVVEDGPEVTMDAEMMLSSKARDTFHEFAPSGLPVRIVGGTSQGRRRLARRVHELSKEPGPFVRVDCALPGSLARMREAENGTLFLDDVPLLSAAGQELLGISLCDDPALELSTRIVCAASDLEASRSRIRKGEFSQDLDRDLSWYTVEIDR
jgi:ClpX C4-type zinc finger/Sigma-54 interaction domain